MFVHLEGVNKMYNRGEENEVAALQNINLQVGRGEMVCIRGPSGSGKTTLVSIIGCVFPPTSGRATVGGRKISRLPDHFLTLYRREMIGFVFQHFNLLAHLSVMDNVSLPLLPLGIAPGVRKKKAEILLDKYGLIHRRDFPVSQLSGGEQQRVALARALINDPQVVVADEPTAHLDSTLSMDVMDRFAALKLDGKTVVVTSHDPLVAGHQAVDRIVDVRDGTIMADSRRER